MDNKTLLAIVLSIAVIIGYQYFAARQQPPVPQKEAQQTAQEAVKKEEAAKPAPPPPVKALPAAPAEEKAVRVETGLYSAVLSSNGATIRFWEMKDYHDKAGKPVILLQKPGVVPAMAIGANTDFDLSHANFRVSGGDLRLDEHNRTGSIVFEYAGSGVSVKRTYTFHADKYTVDITDQVSGLPNYWITVGSDFGIVDKEASYAHVGPVLLQGTDLDELKAKKLKEPKTYKGDLRWIAQEDKYFCAALVPETKVQEARAWLDKDSPVIAFEGNKSVNKFHLYAGPKVQERLEELGLQDIINYGFFSVIARPLFWILKFFYGFLGNYGWAIILLTLVVRIPFLPLVSKGQKSMKKLQDLQPKMNEIKEKYKKDPQKMQKEMMELYKKHKVNPMGGCLPMVAQIPVFFALYKVLLISIELRGAPFMLWITDLSAKDPYYILPVVMGISMVIQQKMTPSSMDPKQQKMMMLMPVVFTFMFLNFASGLVLYWLVNNLLSIIQQIFINKKVAKQKA
ncbi:MAG: membrane protein insertase YidC [Candidatus Sulfobium sp.]